MTSGFFFCLWIELSPINLNFKEQFINRLSLMCDSIIQALQEAHFLLEAADFSKYWELCFGSTQYSTLQCRNIRCISFYLWLIFNFQVVKSIYSCPQTTYIWLSKGKNWNSQNSDYVNLIIFLSELPLATHVTFHLLKWKENGE